MDTHDVVARFVTTLEARDWDTWAALLHPEVTDFRPEPYDPPPGREHLVERW